MPPPHAVHRSSSLDPPGSLSQRAAADRLPPLERRCGPSTTSLPWHSIVDCALPLLPLVPRGGIQGRARPFTAATPLSPFNTANQGRAPLSPSSGRRSPAVPNTTVSMCRHAVLHGRYWPPSSAGFDHPLLFTSAT
ncbi:hypothetical protein VPH35_008034 [Triticum aestivum]